MMVGFGDWEPDVAGLNTHDQNGGALLEIAKNVYPSSHGWAPFPSLSAYQVGTSTGLSSGFATGLLLAVTQGGAAISTGLPARCVGLFAARSSVGGWVIFAGTTTHLYKFNSGTSSWDNYTRVSGGNYNVPSGDYWSATAFGTKVIFCNFNDNPQVIDIDTGATAFADLAGSPPKARYVTVVGDFVILACLNTNPRMFVNSALNDTTGWSIGINLCDEQELPDGDRIVGLSGGEFGYILQERAIRRLIFQPGYDQAFRVERDERERGGAGNYSLVGVRDTIFFYSSDGFYSFGPAGLRPIGHLRVNDWFKANSDSSRQASILGFADQTGPRVFWAFYSGSTSTYFDRLLIYDWDRDRFAYADVSAQFWARATTAAQTLEGLDVYGSIDYPDAGSGPGVGISLDSDVWAGGIPAVGGITTGGLLAFLQGSPLDAILTTSPLQLQPGARVSIDNLFPAGVFNDASVSIRVGRREHTQNPVNYTAPLTPSTQSGIARTKASGRIHNLELTLTQPSGVTWEHAIGIDVDARPDGQK